MPMSDNGAIKGVAALTFLCFLMVTAVTAFAGYINHLIWWFSGGATLLGIAGAALPPIGAWHGVWLWFQ